MTEDRKRKTTTAKVSKRKDLSYYLPPEIWTYSILPTLPVKKLLQFRSVCKLWCSTIDDPAFVSTHLTLSNNNREKKYVMVIERLGRRGEQGCRLTLRHSKTMRRTSSLFDSTQNYYFQVACNGLIFVTPKYVWNFNMEIWNPSIGKCLALPSCPFATRYTGIDYLFGFRPSSNDYVLFLFWKDIYVNMQVSVAAYTLSDNLWRFRDYKLSLPSWFFGGSHKRESIFLDGTLHWFGQSLLVSFDFDEEKFSYLELPDHAREMKTWAYSRYRNLFAFYGLLAIFSISSESSSIWVLKNKVWDRLFHRLSCSVGYNYIRNNPDVVTKSFCVEDGGVTLVYGKVAYKIMSDEIIPLTKSVISRLILDTYLESMVLHKGCPGQVLTSLKPPTNTTDVATSD